MQNHNTDLPFSDQYSVCRPYMVSVMHPACRKCMWRDQCGGVKPCNHFDPIDMEEYMEHQYSCENRMRRNACNISAAEQGNLERE